VLHKILLYLSSVKTRNYKFAYVFYNASVNAPSYNLVATSKVKRGKKKKDRPSVGYLRYMTGTIPPSYRPNDNHAGIDMSKCTLGGLHHPPLFESSAQLGGHRFVPVTTTDEAPGMQYGDP
jgi:hypothetical protein